MRNINCQGKVFGALLLKKDQWPNQWNKQVNKEASSGTKWELFRKKLSLKNNQTKILEMGQSNVKLHWKLKKVSRVDDKFKGMLYF